MIAKLRRANREQRKLLLSLGTSFLTRIPGAIGVVWFLPLLRFGLGTDDYARLLSSTALGTAAAFLTSGFSLVGRRLIGQAYSDGDRAAEADGFVSLLVANAVALGLALAAVVAYCSVCGASIAILFVATLPAVVAFLNTFDNVRAAYNEHYVNATLLIVLQTATYSAGFLLSATRQSIVLGALVLHGPYLLTSVITLALLLRNRLHLTSGRPVAVWLMARQGTMLAMADGFLLATLSLSVVWLQTMADANTSAWFATNVRLFQTLYVPVALLLVPLSSYIRILWNGKSVAQRHELTKATFLIGLGYGSIVGVGLLITSRIYLAWMLHLPTPGGLLQVSPIFLLFGAIISYRSYSSVAYVVLDETAHLSSWTTVTVGGAVALGAAVSLAVDPLSAINVYAVAAAVSVIFVLVWNVARLLRTGPTHGGRRPTCPSRSLRFWVS